MVAGLPNITGNTVVQITNGATGATAKIRSDGGAGALTNSTTTSNNFSYWTRDGTTTEKIESASGILLNASRSNAIYGNSNTVQPPALIINFYIKF